MIRFLYWAENKKTKEVVNFIDENLFDIGSEVTYKGEEVIITDLSFEENISCLELLMQREDMFYV